MKIRAACLALALAAAPLALQAQSNVAEDALHDAWALERVADASDSGRAMPRDVMRTIISESLERLRGADPDGTYRWARYERTQADKDSDRYSLEPTGENEPDSVETTGELAYAIRIDVPSRRLLVARNRRVFIQRIEVNYRELGAFRQNQTIEVNRWIEPGDGVEFPLDDISRRATARVYGWADPEERGSALVEVSWIVPTLTDDPASPFAGSVTTLKELREAVDDRNRETARNLAAQLASQLDRPAAGRRSDLVEEVVAPRPAAVSSASLPIRRDDLLYELRTIDELLRTGGVTARGTAGERLADLIRAGGSASSALKIGPAAAAGGDFFTSAGR